MRQSDKRAPFKHGKKENDAETQRRREDEKRMKNEEKDDAETRRRVKRNDG